MHNAHLNSNMSRTIIWQFTKSKLTITCSVTFCRPIRLSSTVNHIPTH